jgi:HK97 family phage prohead protease
VEHLTLKAVMTTKDQGIFTAVISASSVDREKDVVDPDGMVRALKRWTTTGKNIPLAWNHSGDADQQIGYVDSASAKALNGEVVVSGYIDQSSPVGADAWRQVKLGTLGFSFGYLVPDGGAIKRSGGGRNIMELDVFEVTATPTPINNDTRVLSYKAAEAAAERSVGRVPSEDELQAQARRLGLDLPWSAEGLRRHAESLRLDFMTGQTEAERTAAAKTAAQAKRDHERRDRETRRRAWETSFRAIAGDELFDEATAAARSPKDCDQPATVTTCDGSESAMLKAISAAFDRTDRMRGERLGNGR